MTQDITKVQLSNGLQILLKEIHSAPIISSWVWYSVGSRYKHPGITGVSHWVEHMLFKGTPRFPNGVPDRLIARMGGAWNAMTSMDWTTYYETLPAEHIDLALELEADRMNNGLFDHTDIDPERQVIISEREGYENSPFFRLSEAVQKAAFDTHPYRQDVIGSLEDLHAITREDLFNHYRRYYVPNNAILAIAGDFETATMVEKIKTLFGAIPAGEPVPPLTLSDAPLKAEKRINMDGPGDTPFIMAAYRVPQASHPDFFALTALGSLLTGPSSLNLFGSGLSNTTSRLYRSLVQRELSVSVNGSFQATIDPFLYTIAAIIHPASTTDAVITAIDDEIARVQDAPPSVEALQRAVKQARALFAYGTESISNQAYWLGFAEMFASTDWFFTYIELLNQVTPEDVLRVARTYLNPHNRVLGIYTPSR